MFPGRFSGTVFARRGLLDDVRYVLRSREAEVIIAELGRAIFSLCIVS